MSSLAKALSAAILFGAVGQAAAADNATVATRALGVIHNNPVPTRLSAYDGFTTRDGFTVSLPTRTKRPFRIATAEAAGLPRSSVAKTP